MVLNKDWAYATYLAAGSNQCVTQLAEFERLQGRRYQGFNGCDHWASGLESPRLGSVYQGCTGNGVACSRPSRCRCYTSCVGQALASLSRIMTQVIRQLHSMRPALSDVPAVYFVSPTLANVRRIAEDLDKCLYESFHLNFVEPLPRALLEELATSVATDGTGDLVELVNVLFDLKRIN